MKDPNNEGRDGIYGDHAYSILRAENYGSERLLMIMTPGGVRSGAVLGATDLVNGPLKPLKTLAMFLAMTVFFGFASRISSANSRLSIERNCLLLIGVLSSGGSTS